MRALTIPFLGATALVATLALSGCVANATAETPATLTVDTSATACTVSAATAPAGSVSFTVTNSGQQVSEFYLLAEDGRRVVGEAENIGPGLSRDLVVELSAGSYFTACKPGATGDGVGTADFTVTAADAAAVTTTP